MQGDAFFTFLPESLLPCVLALQPICEGIDGVDAGKPSRIEDPSRDREEDEENPDRTAPPIIGNRLDYPSGQSTGNRQPADEE